MSNPGREIILDDLDNSENETIINEENDIPVKNESWFEKNHHKLPPFIRVWFILIIIASFCYTTAGLLRDTPNMECQLNITSHERNCPSDRSECYSGSCLFDDVICNYTKISIDWIPNCHQEAHLIVPSERAEDIVATYIDQLDCFYFPVGQCYSVHNIHNNKNWKIGMLIVFITAFILAFLYISVDTLRDTSR